jgi:signal transduction histidine kinase/CheY-like chemotaxis protein
MAQVNQLEIEERSDKERFLAVLNDITYAALEIQNLDELLQLLADRLAEIINAKGCFLTLWDEATRTTIPGAAYGPLRDNYKNIQTEPGQPTITLRALDENRTLVIEDAWDSEYTEAVSRQFPTRGMLAIPIQTGDRRLGAALIGYENPHKFQPFEIERCEQAVRQITLAIANLQTTEALRTSEQNYRALAEALQDRERHLDEAQANAKMGSWEQIPQDPKTTWSPGMFRLFDLEPADRPPGRQQLLQQIAPEDREYVKSILGQNHPAEEISPLELRTVKGKHLFGRVFRDPVTGRLMGTMQDVTEQRRLEAELFQARKMEAVGTLAGGIAHNFNNILTVIMGNYELLKNSLPEDTTESRILNQCLEATERAALLTRELLVVSKNHELKPEQIDMNILVTDLAELLAPLVGEHIHLTTRLSHQATVVNADKGHLEQVFMNLVLNARDALQSTGGELTITTEETTDGDRSIVVTVTDNGPGIREEDLPHIFDPFFTTKEEGKGTGLGLATVQSIVQQSRGRVEVVSEEGKGTSISVIIPAVASHAVKASGKSSRPSLGMEDTSSRGNAKILLVEDHESLRDIAILILEKAGYEVIAKERADEAMITIQSDEEFDLVITDVQLPGGMSGRELAMQVTLLRGQTPIIFMSGLREPLPEDAHYYFQPKPFRPTELLSLVGKVLPVTA